MVVLAAGHFPAFAKRPTILCDFRFRCFYFVFVAEQGEQEGTRYIEEHFWGATMAP